MVAMLAGTNLVNSGRLCHGEPALDSGEDSLIGLPHSGQTPLGPRPWIS